MLSPALLVGILFGAFAGNGAELVVGEYRSDIAIYAICGMVAVASAVIGAPLTAILIVFELTRNYDLATAAMVSVVFSNLVAYRIFGRSLFDVQLIRRGFDLSAGRDRVILPRAPLDRGLRQPRLHRARPRRCRCGMRVRGCSPSDATRVTWSMPAVCSTDR